MVHPLPLPLPLLIGPTASGKSSAAVALAHLLRDQKNLPAEIITADSMQVFRGMDIGTAKPTSAERAGIPHHLIDVVEPTEGFSVDRWLALAEVCIADIRSRGALPIIVGGTHLYIQAFLHGMFEGPEPDPALRAALTALSQDDRRAELERVDPEAAGRIHRNDDRRTIRALEVHRATGTPISEHQRQWSVGAPRADAKVFILDWDPEALNRRINARVKQMIADGLVEEARDLWRAGRLGSQAREALGYKQLIDHFEGRCSLEDAVEKIKIETRRFAKNQRTWLRRIAATTGAVRVQAEGKSAEEMASEVAAALHI